MLYIYRDLIEDFGSLEELIEFVKNINPTAYSERISTVNTDDPQPLEGGMYRRRRQSRRHRRNSRRKSSLRKRRNRTA